MRRTAHAPTVPGRVSRVDRSGSVTAASHHASPLRLAVGAHPGQAAVARPSTWSFSPGAVVQEFPHGAPGHLQVHRLARASHLGPPGVAVAEGDHERAAVRPVDLVAQPVDAEELLSSAEQCFTSTAKQPCSTGRPLRAEDPFEPRYLVPSWGASRRPGPFGNARFCR
jgi:hypothetical protein